MKKPEEYLNQYQSKIDPSEVIDQLLEDPTIRRFVMKNDLTHDHISKNLIHFMTFRDCKTICQQCPGIFSCKMSSIGMTPMLTYYNGDVILEYTRCKYNQSKDYVQKIDAYYVPVKIFNASMDDFDYIGQERKAIHQYIMKFLTNYSKESELKGMYLSGIFGGGKTYILAMIANELAKKGHESIFAYYPDLVRELKSSIQQGNLEDMVEKLKYKEFLFLDDFGGESPSAFIRDEVIGPILQFRLLEKKPTFFSSNLPMRVLKDSLAIDSSQAEKTKAIRIYERVNSLALEFEIREKPHI